MPDTIAAIATGSVVSAIGIVRISGPDALTVADNVFRAKSGVKLKDAENRRMYYGEYVTGDGSLSRLSRTIDLCFCMVSRGPNSYTGEDTVEFHCHGSPVILTEVLHTLFSHHVRQALPGEFTKRAFLNGRLDLTQAEAVIDLIESETPSAAKNAAGQLCGAISTKIDSIYNQLLEVASHFHAVIDYPDEDIDDFKIKNYLSIIQDATKKLQQLLETHKRGKILQSGVPTVIIGRPNTGKSTLFNALLGYDRAIVTDKAGTTRDTIEDKILIGDVLLRLIDTAGLRKTDDSTELLGVGRTLTALNNAELVILVIDGSVPLNNDDIDALRSIPPDVPKITAINKSDLPAAIKPSDLKNFDMKCCFLSALSGKGLDILDEEIQKMFHVFKESPSGDLLTNIRQAEAISRAVDSLHQAEIALTEAVTPDAILIDIEDALLSIGEVTGKTMSEDILSRIFERFCVGK